MGREWILQIGRIDRLEHRLDRRIDELEARVSKLFDHRTLGVGAMGRGGDSGSGSHVLATTD
jgi:hypothetical protein